jgi:hypothetical protein
MKKSKRNNMYANMEIKNIKMKDKNKKKINGLVLREEVKIGSGVI